MSDARIEGYARALFEIARAEGTLDEVEDELFRFGRSFEASDELRTALTDEMIPAAKRQAIVEDLLGGKATSTTTQLVSMVVGSGRGRELPAIIDKLVARASSSPTTSRSDSRPRWRMPRASRSRSRWSSTHPCWAASLPPWATPSSTAPSVPVSSS